MDHSPENAPRSKLDRPGHLDPPGPPDHPALELLQPLRLQQPQQHLCTQVLLWILASESVSRQVVHQPLAPT